MAITAITMMRTIIISEPTPIAARTIVFEEFCPVMKVSSAINKVLKHSSYFLLPAPVVVKLDIAFFSQISCRK